MRYSPFLSCRQASRLITDQFDRELGLLERTALRLHLSICDACPKVIAQFATLRASLRSVRDDVEGETRTT